ncbi:MAG: SUMF1/EgtB/PvdO family nonheme iron enzyme, partial [Planctomycetota bacterium]
WIRRESVSLPLYWRNDRADGWLEFTLTGERPLDPRLPVCHLGFYEAEAFARWAGARLPSEFEWEAAASESNARFGCTKARWLETADLHPSAADAAQDGTPRQLVGDAWEWTRSDYAPYPGYCPPDGALSEYNGKFMSGQYVLRGGCCVTPRGHASLTYRNFYFPTDRWQFAGLRLARDATR